MGNLLIKHISIGSLSNNSSVLLAHEKIVRKISYQCGFILCGIALFLILGKVTDAEENYMEAKKGNASTIFNVETKMAVCSAVPLSPVFHPPIFQTRFMTCMMCLNWPLL